MASFLERYHELTKYDPRTIDHAAGASWQDQPRAWKTIQGEEYHDIRPHLEFLQGFAGGALPGVYPRPSARLDLAALARLSWFASGVSAMGGTPEDPHLYRTNPSAGGLYPVEQYWIVLDVDGMEPGVWQFHAPGFALVPVWKGNFRAETAASLLGAGVTDSVQAVAVLTGIFSRGSWRYGERAYRRMLLDAGHLAGNLMEAVRREGKRSSPQWAFCDAGLADLLFPDEDEVPLLAVAVGVDQPGPVARLRSPDPDPTELASSVEPGRMQRKAHHLARIPPSGADPIETRHKPTRKDGLVYVELPEPGQVPAPIQAAIDRRSCRSFAWAPATERQLSTLLQWSRLESSEALAPEGLLDTWLVVHSVEGIDSGIYHWDPATHAIACLRVGGFREDALRFCLARSWEATLRSFWSTPRPWPRLPSGWGREPTVRCAWTPAISASGSTCAPSRWDSGPPASVATSTTW